MAVTQQNYTGNGSTTNYSFTFPYLAQTDVKVKLNGVTQATTTYSFANATTISMNSAPGNGVAIIIFRDTNNDSKKATFYPGSAIKAEDLNNDFDQILYVAQEVDNNAMSTLGEDPMQGDLPMGNNKLTNLATPTAGTDGANKNYVDNKTWGSAAIIDGSIVNADINASAAIAGTKISPDFGSQNIATSGTVDGRDVSADGTKLDTIESNATADQTAAEIRTLVENATDSNVFTDADHTKLNAIEASATADQTAAEIRTLVDSATDSNVFTDADHTKLNAAATLTDSQTLTNKTLTSPVINDMSGTAVVTSGTSTSDTKTYSAKRAGEIFYGKGTVEEIQSGETWTAADDKVATTSAIDARIIDLVDDVGGFVPIANETSFPNANPDVNNGAGTLVSIKALSSNLTSNGSGVATIANGTVGNSTVTINGLANSTTYASTYGMIVETTTTLNTYTFHRLVPKATEVTTVSTNITNVNAVGNNITNVNSVAGNATNINTVAGNNSNVTTVAGANSNITTVATNISDVNNFADLYQIATSAPSTDGGGNSLAVGDLWFDSSSNKQLKVHNGTAFQSVSPTQSVLNDISIVSGQITFTEDLGSIADSLTTGTGNNINTVATNISNVNTVAGISSNVTTVAGNNSNINTVAGANSNVNTVASSIADVNRYANEYKIASSAPGSPSEGDLWYDSTNNLLKYHNGSGFIGITSGLTAIVSDTSPALGGHLDCNDKNLTEVGTVSGNNLQIDFGTLS